MTATGLVPAADGQAVWDRRHIALFAALGLAVVTQAVLAFAYGAAPGTAREGWTVALHLVLLLALPGAGIALTTWTARNLTPALPIGLAITIAGLLMRAPYMGAGPMLEDDHFRYLLDGAMVAQGLSPYAHAPQALLDGVEGALRSLVEPGQRVIAAINFPELRSIYPSGAQLLFGLAHLAAPWKLDGLRAVIFASEAITALLIWRWLIVSRRSPQLVALFWCNPLMAFCLTGQAHIDAALGPPILLALLATRRHAGALAGASLAFAAGVKLWPVLLAPLVMRGLWPDRRAIMAFVLTFGLLALLLCAPLLLASLSLDAGLTAYASGWSVNNGPYAWTSYLFFFLFGPVTGEKLLRGLVIIAALGLSIAVAWRALGERDDLAARSAILAGALFYLSPAQFPWYAAWFLPLAAASGSWALIMASIGLPIYYLFFPLAAAGLRDVHGYGLAFLHLLPVLLMVFFSRRATPAGVAS